MQIADVITSDIVESLPQIKAKQKFSQKLPPITRYNI